VKQNAEQGIFCNKSKFIIMENIIKTDSPLIDRPAVSPYDYYCDGYSMPGSTGNGYVSVLKVSVGQVFKSDDALLDGIVAYDRAEANDAYAGQINMITASSFCGLAGQIWGYDLAQADEIKNNSETPVLYVTQYDGSQLPVYDGKHLLDAGIALFGTEDNRRYPPVPGGHIICANKSITSLRPINAKVESDLKDGEAFGVWCYIAISITRDRDTSADLFIEDAGLWTKNDQQDELKAFLDDHRKSVAMSIVACGKDQSVLYDRTYISYNYLIMEPDFIGTALTCAPYITLARKAVPDNDFSLLKNMTLSDWMKLNQFT
jgi:histidine decarboxylase